MDEQQGTLSTNQQQQPQDKAAADKQHWDDELDKWKKRIDYMEKYFKDAEERHGWKNFKKFLWSKVSQAVSIAHPIVTVNDIYAYLKTTVAGLYSKNPYIAVNPKTADQEQSAIIKEQVINATWKELALKRYVKKAIVEAKLIGHSWIKGGYEADIEQDDAVDENGNSVAGEVNEHIVGERIWAIHVPHNEIYFDPDAKDAPYDCRWIEHHYLKPVAWLKKRYNIEGTIEPTYKPTEPQANEKANRNDLPSDDIEMTMVHEVWDKDDGCKKIFCDGYDGWLDIVEPEKPNCIGPYHVKGFPFKMLKFNDFPSADGKDNFPMADIEAWIDQFLEKIKIRSAQIDHIKRYNRQVLFDKNKVQEADMENFIKGVTGSNIPVDGNPNEIMAPAPAPTIPTDAYAVENKIDQDKDRVSGLASFEMGGAASSRTRTVGELDHISAGSDSRRQEQVDIVEDFCVEVAEMILDFKKQFADESGVVRVSGRISRGWQKKLVAAGKFDGRAISYTKQDLQGDEELDIKAGSSLPMNKENRINTVIQIAKFGPAIGLVPGSLAAIELGRQLMRDLDLVTVERAFEIDAQQIIKQRSQPNPAQQLDQAQKQANLQKTAVDTELKKGRAMSVNLGNVSKAVDNAREMRQFSKIGGDMKEVGAAQ